MSARSHRPPRPAGHSQRPGPPKAQRGGHQSVWLYGRHPVLAALANPERRIERILATKEVADLMEGEFKARPVLLNSISTPSYFRRNSSNCGDPSTN